MPDSSTKQNILKTVAGSPTFSGSPVSQNLLRYLVESSMAGHPPKEVDIAIHVFGKDKRFDSTQDNIVRSNIYTLRKKLEKYYSEEGQKDHIRITIPKGHYEVDFVKKDDDVKPRAGTRDRNLTIPIVGIAILLLLNVYQWSQRTVSTPVRSMAANPLWSDFVNPDERTTIIVGNEFFFRERADDLIWPHFVINQQITSMEELHQYIKTHPGIRNDYLAASNSLVTYVPGYVPSSLFELLELFGGNHRNLVVKESSNVTWQDLKNNNVLFIGNFYSLNLIRHLFTLLHSKYQLWPRGIYLTSDAGDTLDFFQSEFVPSSYPQQTSGYPPQTWFVKNDYAVAAKMPGPEGKSIFMISAFMGVSIEEAIRFFKRPESVGALEKIFIEKSGRMPEFFEVLLEIQGIEGLGYSASVKHAFEIDPDHHLKWLRSQQDMY